MKSASPSTTEDVREEALIAAMDQWGVAIIQYLESLTRNHADAENLSQDLWVQVYEKFPLEKMAHWGLLRHKAYQLFVDQWRRKKNRPEELIPDEPFEMNCKNYVHQPYSDEEEQRFEIQFWEMFPEIELTDVQKATFYFSARYGMTVAEISEETGIAKSTVGDWIRLAKKRLAEKLEME